MENKRCVPAQKAVAVTADRNLQISARHMYGDRGTGFADPVIYGGRHRGAGARTAGRCNAAPAFKDRDPQFPFRENLDEFQIDTAWEKGAFL